MNTLLLVITVLAVAVAAASLVALFVAFRAEQRRSYARIEALRQMGGPDPSVPGEDLPVEFDDFGAYDDAIAAGPQKPMFSPTFNDADSASPWRRRIAVAIVMAVIVAAAGYVLIPRNTAAPAPVSAAQPGTQAPLELLSLRHTQEEGRLVITGLVQNPRAGVPLTRVVATAFLFSADGTFLASGRAPLDFSTLAAGDESPFVVTVPVTGTVARYRVGFRGEDGRVIAHVDRRTAGTLARTGGE